MTKPVPPSVSAYMATIGRKGGKNGKGTPKSRDPSHYKKMGEASGRARRKKSRAKVVDFERKPV
jgi:general stress protein YciG